MDMTRKIAVKSRNLGRLVYNIPSLRVRRVWYNTGDIIYIPLDELVELTTVEGGRRMLDEYLLIEDEEALMLLYDYELPPEYAYGEAEIDYLLHHGTNEQLFDALDYAPEGVLYLIRSMAIKQQPDTIAKLDAINKKFNIDILKIVKNAEVTEETEEEKPVSPRRSEPVNVPEQTSKYKVVNRR